MEQGKTRLEAQDACAMKYAPKLNFGDIFGELGL
jgi:hypothetical protein